MSETWDTVDERLAERLRALVERDLGDDVRLESSRSADGYFFLSIFNDDSAEPALYARIGAGEIFITDENILGEESDDLDTDVDRAEWASDLIGNLARFGATRITHRSWSPKSFNQLHVWESANARADFESTARGRVVGEFQPFLAQDSG